MKLKSKISLQWLFLSLQRALSLSYWDYVRAALKEEPGDLLQVLRGKEALPQSDGAIRCLAWPLACERYCVIVLGAFNIDGRLL